MIRKYFLINKELPLNFFLIPHQTPFCMCLYKVSLSKRIYITTVLHLLRPHIHPQLFHKRRKANAISSLASTSNAHPTGTICHWSSIVPAMCLRSIWWKHNNKDSIPLYMALHMIHIPQLYHNSCCTQPGHPAVYLVMTYVLLLSGNTIAHANTTGEFPDSKVHGAIMGPIWGRQDPSGPHVGPMNIDIWVVYLLQPPMCWINLNDRK